MRFSYFAYHSTGDNKKDLSNLGRQNLNSARELITNHAEQDTVKNMVDLIITTTDVVAMS